MYKWARNILFLFDAEKVHYFSMNMLRFICRIPLVNNIIRNCYRAPNTTTKVFGITFKNPVGLGAGFDKNALYLNELETLGFGFIEIGTVTPLPQKGNDRPRLFRLPKDKALLNRMGFNNDGVKVVAARLQAWRATQAAGKNARKPAPRLIVGGNIGKNKRTPNEEAWKDYEICFRGLFDQVDYFVINVSSPNTPGLRALQQKDQLEKIIFGLQLLNKQMGVKPLLLKISPDLAKDEVDDIVDLCLATSLSGIVVANTTISRENLLTNPEVVNKNGAGGLSGKPLQKVSTSLIRDISNRTKGRLTIIGSGGLFNGSDALEKQAAGAELFQVWTGFIYEGPSIVKNICTHLINKI